MRETIEELLELKVVRERNNPWLLCYKCFKFLTDFYMFKQQCRENHDLLNRQRTKKHGERKLRRTTRNLKAKRESCEDINYSDEDIASCQVVTRAASKLQDSGSTSLNNTILKTGEMDDEEEEVVEIPASQGSMDQNVKIRDGTSLEGNSEDNELHLSSDEEVNRKEKFDADIPHEERHLREGELLAQESGQKRDGPVKNATGTVLHVCHICDKVFAQRDLLKDHVMHVHINKNDYVETVLNITASMYDEVNCLLLP
ncbi:uncharacterized protein [Hetaerina americana]|uniref:uncharacterized protein n=1 Tax=Hetaerina americana TaxID=62018 RepID=UPI003A7F5F86